MNCILRAGSGWNISNFGGEVVSLGFNLSSDAGVENSGGGTGDLNANGDRINTDPMGTVTWSLADLPSGEAEGAELMVKVLIKGKTTVTNSASVTADTSDPNTQNNAASITTTVDAGGGGKKK